jgi:hypothetical protein
MTTSRTSIPLLFALVLLGGMSRVEADTHAGVGGKVRGESSPLPSAGVYAYQLADASLRKVVTDAQGNFLFQDLPAGLYQIIAHKVGFTPVVVLLTRTTALAYQSVELQLVEQRRDAGQRAHPDDFWSVRSAIPGDVLRQIQNDEMEVKLAEAPQRLNLAEMAKAGFSTSMQAMTGVDQIDQANGLVSGGGVGIEGQLGQVQVGLRGSYRQLNADSSGRPGISSSTGQASSLSFDVARGPGSRLSFTSQSNRMARSNDGEAPIDFEHYQVSFTQKVGENGRSDFSATAGYTTENNYWRRPAAIEPREIPEASRIWHIDGGYTADLGDGNTLQTGMRYRELQFGAATPGRPATGPTSNAISTADIDLFSRGGMRVQPAVLLEYGLYSTLSDGSVSLMPQGGVVLQLASDWQLEGSASRRAYQNVSRHPIFMPLLFEDADLCEQGSESCYRVSLGRKPVKDDTDSSVALTATHRKIGDTLRFYFSEDTFDRLESLYLVRGDELPELRLQVSKHLTPHVVTTLDSSIGSGGGGMFLAADRPYENQVRYLTASLDTQFLTSSTGVFLAFHRLSQGLQPLDGSGIASQMEVERLRLMLTQDLKSLFNLASGWAVQLDMELSRGPVSSTVSSSHDNELRRRLMGGIAVKF